MRLKSMGKIYPANRDFSGPKSISCLSYSRSNVKKVETSIFVKLHMKLN